MAYLKNRYMFIRVNKYQQTILNVVIAGSFVTVTILAGCVAFLSQDIAQTILDPNQRLPLAKFLITLALMVLPITFLIAIFWAFKFSNNLLGAFERIIRELDETLEGKRTGPLKVRKNDEMFQELLQRINTLLERKDRNP